MRNIFIALAVTISGALASLSFSQPILATVTHRRTQTAIVNLQDVKVDILFMSDGTVRWETVE